MQIKIVWQWEVIDEFVSRVKVKGGWLVKTTVTTKNGVAVDTMFLADQHHEWCPCEPFVDIEVKKASIAKDFEPKKK